MRRTRPRPSLLLLLLLLFQNLSRLIDNQYGSFGSEGLQGIAVEVTVRVYPQRLVKNSQSTIPTQEMVSNIHNIISRDKNAFMLVTPDLTMIETKTFAPEGTRSSELVSIREGRCPTPLFEDLSSSLVEFTLFQQ